MPEWIHPKSESQLGCLVGWVSEWLAGSMAFAYYSEGKDDEDNSSRRRLSSFTHTSHTPALSHLLPPSSSSTCSSSPTAISRNVSQADANDDQPGSSSGADPQPIPKEHMFDKVVTPSDVGKLNRLVIPKQHAEKYFPLDSSKNEKGLLLNFEDRNGKPWRFRYSYWNSSQSYVMTKGWSRFVKEKRLDAGDTVSFGRGVGEAVRDRLFIDWKRKPEIPNRPDFSHLPMQNPYIPMMSFAHSVMPWNHSHTQPIPPYNVYMRSPQPYSHYSHPQHSRLGVQMQYSDNDTNAADNGGGDTYAARRSAVLDFDSVPVGHSSLSSTNSKHVRLFGVNLDCSPSSSYIDPCAPLTTSQVRPLLSPPLSLQLGLSNSTADVVDQSPRKDKQPMSLDFDI